jgi:hypothetical protein
MFFIFLDKILKKIAKLLKKYSNTNLSPKNIVKI